MGHSQLLAIQTLFETVLFLVASVLEKQWAKIRDENQESIAKFNEAISNIDTNKFGDELKEKNDSVVPVGKVSDARCMKQSSGDRETETSNTLDITCLGTLLWLFGYPAYPQDSS